LGHPKADNEVNDVPLPDKLQKLRERYPEIKFQLTPSGNFCYPIGINRTLKIINLGKVIPDVSFKGPNIFPIGYKAIRLYYSLANPSIETEYIMEIF
jgi:hypothetical protein